MMSHFERWFKNEFSCAKQEIGMVMVLIHFHLLPLFDAEIERISSQ